MHYCPTHYRGWLGNAHRVLDTRVILSHIAHNAKPVFGAIPTDEKGDPFAEAPARKPKKRAIPKNRKG